MFFLFTDPPTTEIYTLSLHDALPIFGGVEIHRFGLQDELLKLVEGAQIPVAATMLGKSVVRETHPLYIGIYEGAMGRSEEHTSELQSQSNLVCRLLLEKKKKKQKHRY